MLVDNYQKFENILKKIKIKPRYLYIDEETSLYYDIFDFDFKTATFLASFLSSKKIKKHELLIIMLIILYDNINHKDVIKEILQIVKIHHRSISDSISLLNNYGIVHTNGKSISRGPRFTSPHNFAARTLL